ncbi:hypothetical protein AMTR_s00124p00121450 [Amborella trichopoda]|uniref:Uncharacterized protein n=1 Tax=Amborella trichopoda TaxID=13333 RepID=W1NRU8_AMBTC|nr:hypothetical protein AMTR_s00124p00121450 [Amborella trichopoda]
MPCDGPVVRSGQRGSDVTEGKLYVTDPRLGAFSGSNVREAKRYVTDPQLGTIRGSDVREAKRYVPDPRLEAIRGRQEAMPGKKNSLCDEPVVKSGQRKQRQGGKTQCDRPAVRSGQQPIRGKIERERLVTAGKTQFLTLFAFFTVERERELILEHCFSNSWPRLAPALETQKAFFYFFFFLPHVLGKMFFTVSPFTFTRRTICSMLCLAHLFGASSMPWLSFKHNSTTTLHRTSFCTLCNLSNAFLHMPVRTMASWVLSHIFATLCSLLHIALWFLDIALCYVVFGAFVTTILVVLITVIEQAWASYFVV